MNKIIYYIGLATIAGAIVLVITLFFWDTYPYKTANIYNQPIPVTPTVISRGSIVHLLFDFCSYGYVSPNIQTFLVASTRKVIAAPRTGTPAMPRCGKESIAYIIPDGAELGKQYIEIDADYQVNPIKKIHTAWVTQSFTVTK